MNKPLVTVVCLCYNQEKYVRQAIESVWSQTHAPVQLIIVDDASTDNSVSVIQEMIKDIPGITFISNRSNVGNCRSFNEAFKLSTGNFLVDLAADDILLPDRIAEGVKLLEEAGHDFGVQFSDAVIISEDGRHLHYHSDRFPHSQIPQGDIYKNLINRYFICSPTMMFRREVLAYTNGYDESLAFEDFDMWIRSARKFKYCYSPKVLVKRRLVTNSMSRKQFSKNKAQRWSTLVVCNKIKELNQTDEENDALRHRLWYEFSLSIRMMDFRLALGFLRLL